MPLLVAKLGEWHARVDLRGEPLVKVAHVVEVATHEFRSRLRIAEAVEVPTAPVRRDERANEGFLVIHTGEIAKAEPESRRPAANGVLSPLPDAGTDAQAAWEDRFRESRRWPRRVSGTMRSRLHNGDADLDGANTTVHPPRVTHTSTTTRVDAPQRNENREEATSPGGSMPATGYQRTLRRALRQGHRESVTEPANASSPGTRPKITPKITLPAAMPTRAHVATVGMTVRANIPAYGRRFCHVSETRSGLVRMRRRRTGGRNRE